MLTRFLSSGSLGYNTGLALVRIITGMFMIYHGYEVFDVDKMKGYEPWLTDLKFPHPLQMAYIGKGAEFFWGILLMVGFLTRISAIALVITMAVICFFMGNGKIFTDDQHPFLFVLLAAVFFFTGAGKWSVDQLLFKYKNINS